MDQCGYYGCWYNDDGHCTYSIAPIKVNGACVCHDIDETRSSGFVYKDTQISNKE